MKVRGKNTARPADADHVKGGAKKYFRRFARRSERRRMAGIVQSINQRRRSSTERLAP
jgi:hypothetical protein